jgi:hypothetical protein
MMAPTSIPHAANVFTASHGDRLRPLRLGKTRYVTVAPARIAVKAARMNQPDTWCVISTTLNSEIDTDSDRDPCDGNQRKRNCGSS